MSQRHVGDEDDRLLDAARTSVLAVGVRRTTVTDVARRAGVSRMTLYRRFPDLESLLSALMTREFGRLVAQARDDGNGATARERVVTMTVSGARALACDPLFERLVDVDPELLLPYVTTRLGGMQRMAVAAAAHELARADGSVREDAPPGGLAGGERVDVVVVGGGITGAGVALDAVSRGLSVALLERRDLAHGTSRWSSKLVHGGIRYLARGEVAVAWESVVERARLMQAIAPHLIRPLPFVLPLAGGLSPGRGAGTQAVFHVGDAMRVASRTRRRVIPAARRISALEARRLAPALPEAGLRGALLYWDGQLEDDARLVVAVARTAAAHGARIVTRAEVTALRDDGVEAVDRRTGDA